MKETKSTPAVQVRQSKPITEQIEYKIVSDRKINLTSELAYKFLEMETFSGERQVNDNHVQHLFDEFCSGRFMWEQVTIGICRVGDKAYRVNGQHSCWLRVNIKDGKDTSCIVRELVYEVPDENNLRMLYSTFDQGKSRSNAHNFKVMMMDKSAARDIRASYLGPLATGLKLWLWEERRHIRAKSGAADLSILIGDQYGQLFKTVGMFYQANIPQYPTLKRASIIAALFATFEASANKAQEFWSVVVSGLGLTEKTDARYMLRKFIDTHSHHISEGKTPVSQEEMFRVCIQAWNRWRKNEPVLSLRATEKRVKAV